MKSTFILRLLLLTASVIIWKVSWSQYLNNGSLEGELGDAFPPYDWYIMPGDDFSDPDLMASYMTYSGSRLYEPVDGGNFVLLRARGVHYAHDWHGPRQREYLYQPLIKPLEKNSCFQLNVYLCTNPDYGVEDEVNPYVGFPLKFQVWGSDHAGGRDVLLVDSDPISYTEWLNYSFIFLVADNNISYLLVEPQWDTVNVYHEPYNGMILVDAMSLIRTGEAGILHEYTLYYHGDNKDVLTASPGYTYEWLPHEAVSSPYQQTVTVRTYEQTITAIIRTGDECPVMDIFHLIIDCDTLYPEDTNRVVNHYYRYEEDIFLEASKGISYDWEPEINLSAYDVQSPRMTAFHDHYSVVVTNQYDCKFSEYFNIILNCDTLYPEKTITVLDTLLNPGSSVTLNPRYGYVNGEWYPISQLSCFDCQNPVATPQSSVQYNVLLSDDYGCYHNEIFLIEVSLKIPNTITPNSDGFNDCLRVFGLPEGSVFRLFDKEGRLLYTRDPYTLDDCWYGTDQQGKPLKAGNYWYAFDHPVLGTISTGFIFLKR
ncbi:MAG: gliding motility-associated C-terminal domain-containing protein [Bacteroidales bacterium]|nr:gliding motility-associated C-terminal domain-containing protein [Bacteroidales bacterium]